MGVGSERFALHQLIQFGRAGGVMQDLGPGHEQTGGAEEYQHS